MKTATVFQNQPAVEINDEANRLIITPEHGANVVGWEHQGRPVISWSTLTPQGKLRGGNPILFPFIARHFVDGKMELWRGKDGVVRPMPMHGFARQARFTVIPEADDKSLRMRLTDSPETQRLYPFSFQFDVVVTLRSRSRLEFRFEVTNRGPTPMPYQAGHHFYLAIPPAGRADWALNLPCSSWGWQNPDGSIRQEKASGSLLHLDDPTLSDRFQIHPCGSELTLRNTRTQQRLVLQLNYPDSVPWYAVTTWTESPESNFYCVEPWLGLPNAIHHGEGLRHLSPGQMETATCVINAVDW